MRESFKGKVLLGIRSDLGGSGAVETRGFGGKKINGEENKLGGMGVREFHR